MYLSVDITYIIKHFTHFTHIIQILIVSTWWSIVEKSTERSLIKKKLLQSAQDLRLRRRFTFQQDNNPKHIAKTMASVQVSEWIDDELGEAFSQRNMAKVLAAKSKLEIDEQNYRTLRNYAVKLNRKKKNIFYNNAFIDCKTDSKKGMDHS